jgi:hypothetical protein
MELKQLEEFKWLLYDGIQETTIDIEFLSKEFPLFTEAIKKCAKEQDMPSNVFLFAAVHTYQQPTNKKKRFQSFTSN